MWRIKNSADLTPRTLIVKWAPPYIASAPDVPLDPDRIILEAKILSAFDSGKILSELGNELVRPPRLFLLDQSSNAMVMEDICQCPDLGVFVEGTRATIY